MRQKNPNGTFGEIVWVTLGGKLYLAAPEHLRPTMEREGIMFEMNNPRNNLDPKDLILKREYEDLTGQESPHPDEFELGHRVLEPSGDMETGKPTTEVTASVPAWSVPMSLGGSKTR